MNVQRKQLMPNSSERKADGGNKMLSKNARRKLRRYGTIPTIVRQNAIDEQLKTLTGFDRRTDTRRRPETILNDMCDKLS